MKKYFLYLYIFFGIQLYAQELIPIINLHFNDSLGVSNLVNQTVKISGIITAAKHFGASGPAFIQDITGGVSVYGSRLTNYVQIGDSVTLSSKVVNYNGLTQIDFSTGTFTKHSSGNTVEPMLVTIDMIKNQTWNGVEELEGRLVRLSNVKIIGSGNFAGNTTYTVTDSINTLDLRIDGDVTSIVGTPIPQSKVDIIGIVGQYKPSSPYNSGYQLMPRSLDDIVTLYVPVIIPPVILSNVTENSFSVFFNTLREGNTEIRWGKTTSLELGTIVKPELTTEHQIDVQNLEKNVRYYFKVFSTNQYGTSESGLQTAVTSVSSVSSGKINVYFNSSVDNSVAIPGNNAVGNVDFKSKIINRINNANYSIDIALYSFFGMDDIANAIIAAKNRGVKVRVVYDSRTTQSSMQLLINAGIKISKRPSGLSGIMHNKFAIFDGRDATNENDWVWTGSFNWTSSEINWRNNAIEINDHNLAAAFTKEFEEMWGSNTDEPNSSNAKFGSQKIDNTPHTFDVNGIPVKLYFSPSDNTEDNIKSAILTADSSLYFALLIFTSDNLYNAINSRYQAGLRDIRGIIDDVNANGSEFQKLSAIAQMFDYNLGNTLHHKYGIIDASYPTKVPTVITGSHNWSRAANEDNDENTLIIQDIYIANQYMQEFKKRYNDLGGTTNFVIPIISSVNDNNYVYPNSIELKQNYPNPFNPITTITFFNPIEQDVKLYVYNLLGEKVKILFDGIAKAGLNVIDFKADNLSSGIYIYQLETKQGMLNKKCVLLK
jgi:phosphatidylserine/phosphatidylglycerophosphate/cardiolipin synthase-like enzyme